MEDASPSLFTSSSSSSSLFSASQNLSTSKRGEQPGCHWVGGREEALHGQGGLEVLLGRVELLERRPMLICGQRSPAETSLTWQEGEEGGGDPED